MGNMRAETQEQCHIILPSGGLNSTISFFAKDAPCDPSAAFKAQYRCLSMDPA